MWLNKTYEQIVAGLCGTTFCPTDTIPSIPIYRILSLLPFHNPLIFPSIFKNYHLACRKSHPITQIHTDTVAKMTGPSTYALHFSFHFQIPDRPMSTTRSHVNFANTISTDPAKKGHPSHLLLSHPAGSPNGTATPRNTISCNSAPGLRNGTHPRTLHPRDLLPKRRRREQNIHMAYRERMEARLMRTRWAVMGPEGLEARMQAVMGRGVLE